MELTADLFILALSGCTQVLTNQILSDVRSRDVLPYQDITCIPREHKPFCLVHFKSVDYAISAAANLLLYERLKIPVAYSKPSQTSKMELFTNLVFS